MRRDSEETFDRSSQNIRDEASEKISDDDETGEAGSAQRSTLALILRTKGQEVAANISSKIIIKSDNQD